MLVIICVCLCVCFFFFKQKTAYEMRISDWSSDVCSSDLKRVYWSDRTPASGVRSTANTDFFPITPKYCVIYQHWNVRPLSFRSASSGSISRRLRSKSCKVQLVRSLHRLMFELVWPIVHSSFPCFVLLPVAIRRIINSICGSSFCVLFLA